MILKKITAAARMAAPWQGKAQPNVYPARCQPLPNGNAMGVLSRSELQQIVADLLG
ncbi:MAG: hypothetical protein KGM49_07425 [Sphingomonadales bacterium]|nr:hypothetical protein [Sphingomonadales bacterium]